MNLQWLTFRRLHIAGLALAVLIAAWVSVPLVLGNSSTSNHEPGWPYLPIAFIGCAALVWFTAWNSCIILAGSFARRFRWPLRTAILVLSVGGALVLFLLLTAGWVFVVGTVQDWARVNSSELWYSAARNGLHAFDRVAFHSFVMGALLLVASQLLPNPSLERTSTGRALGP